MLVAHSTQQIEVQLASGRQAEGLHRTETDQALPTQRRYARWDGAWRNYQFSHRTE